MEYTISATLQKKITLVDDDGDSKQQNDFEIETVLAPRPTTASDTALYRLKLASFVSHEDISLDDDQLYQGSVRLLGVSAPYSSNAYVTGTDRTQHEPGVVIGHICRIDNVWRVTNPFHTVVSLPRTPIRLRISGPSGLSVIGLTLSLRE